MMGGHLLPWAKVLRAFFYFGETYSGSFLYGEGRGGVLRFFLGTGGFFRGFEVLCVV